KQTTGIQNIDSNSYLDEKIGISDINEQQKISNFLDYKTSQFDSIIEKKEKLIEKLEEAKKSLISEVVTGKVKIVDGKLVKRDKSEMKDSGVEWLGKIPKDWEVKKLKHIIKEPLMYGANESGENNNTELPRYIRITDFDLDGNLRENTFKSLEYKKATGFFLREGDILFARSGATVGKTFIFKDYEGKACFAGYLIKAVLDRNKCMPEFFYYFTKSFSYENWKKSIVIQATIENISAEKYRELQIAKPNIKEQLDINKYIEKLINDYNLTLDRNKKQIEKLKQAKQSLISEAVTGKIDLRDWEIKEIDN
ncbi:MAG: restriction endonuclease subunit S, partial [Tissierellales bacterium]|nr:restriction endonuclease subunit S [Tissierellales bacterium]